VTAPPRGDSGALGTGGHDQLVTSRGRATSLPIAVDLCPGCTGDVGLLQGRGSHSRWRRKAHTCARFRGILETGECTTRCSPRRQAEVVHPPNFIGLSRRQLEGPQVFISDSGNIRPSWMNIKRVDNRVSFDRCPGRGRGYVGPGAGLPERLGAGSWFASSSGSGPATCRA